MHNMSKPEADGLQQQKTIPGIAPVRKNRKRTLQFTQAHQNWTIEDWKNVAWSDDSRFLLWHSDGRVRIWCKEHESMDPSCLVSTVQAGGGGGVMVWGIFSWHTLGPLVPIEHRLNATAYLSIVADHVHPFMTTVYLLMATSSRIMHHVTKLKSSQTGFLNTVVGKVHRSSTWVKVQIRIIKYYSIKSKSTAFSILLEWKYKSTQFFMYLSKKVLIDRFILQFYIDYFISFYISTYFYNHTAQNTWVFPKITTI